MQISRLLNLPKEENKEDLSYYLDIVDELNSMLDAEIPQLKTLLIQKNKGEKFFFSQDTKTKWITESSLLFSHIKKLYSEKIEEKYLILNGIYEKIKTKYDDFNELINEICREPH